MANSKIKIDVELNEIFNNFKKGDSIFKDQIKSYEHFVEVLDGIRQTIQDIQSFDPKIKIPKMNAIDPLEKNLSYFPMEAVEKIIEKAALKIESRYRSPVLDSTRPMEKTQYNAYNNRLVQEQNASHKNLLANDLLAQSIKKFNKTPAIVNADNAISRPVIINDHEDYRPSKDYKYNNKKLTETLDDFNNDITDVIKSVDYTTMMGLGDQKYFSKQLQALNHNSDRNLGEVNGKTSDFYLPNETRELRLAASLLQDNVTLIKEQAKNEKEAIISTKKNNREDFAHIIGFGSEAERRKFTQTTGIPKENLIEIAKMPGWNAAFKTDNLDNMTPRELNKLQSQMDRLASQGIFEFTDMIKRMSSIVDAKWIANSKGEKYISPNNKEMALSKDLRNLSRMDYEMSLMGNNVVYKPAEKILYRKDYYDADQKAIDDYYAKNKGDDLNTYISDAAKSPDMATLNDTLKNTAESLSELSKNADETSDEFNEFADSEKAQKKVNEARKEREDAINKLNDEQGTSLNTEMGTFKLIDALQNMINKTLEKMDALGDYETLDDKGKNTYNNLDARRKSYTTTLNSVNESLSKEAFWLNKDAMNASMYSNAYSRLNRIEGQTSTAAIKKEYGERLFRSLSNLDLGNFVGDALKRSLPIMFEGATRNLSFNVSKAIKNGVFEDIAANDETLTVYKKFKKQYLRNNPDLNPDNEDDEKKIRSAFSKDAKWKGMAFYEMSQRDGIDGKDRVGTISKANSTALFGPLGNLLSPIAGVAAAAIGSLAENIAKLSKEAVEAYQNIQSLQTQLGVVFASQGEAANMFQKFADYAVVSPFGVNTMVQQGIQLKQSGVSGSELLDTMKRIGDISSGNQDKMKSISDVYSRVMASTTVTARDMRQLVNAGVPAYDALTKAMQENPNGRNISRSNIRSLLQSGKVTSEDFELMLKNLTDEGGMFYGATAVGAKTLKARKQNLSDIKELSLATMGEWLTKFGGTNTNNSFYGKILKYQENFYSFIKESFENGVKVKNINTAEDKIKNYEKYENILKQAGNLPPEIQGILARLGGDYTYGDSVAAKADKYKTDKSKYLNGKTIISDEDMRQLYEAKVYGSNLATKRPDNKFIELANRKDGKDIINQIIENSRTESFAESEIKKANNGKDYSVDYKIVKFAEALTRGSDSIEKFINATKGATAVVTSERQRYESTSVGSLIKSDKEYQEKENLKKEMLGFNEVFTKLGSELDSSAIGVKSKEKPNGLTLDKYNRMVELMASEQSAMQLSSDNIFEKNAFGFQTKDISEQSQKDWKTLNTNLYNLGQMIYTSDVSKKDQDNILPILREMYKETQTSLTSENAIKSLEDLSESNSKLEEAIKNVSDPAKRKMLEQALNNSYTRITFDTERANDINKSGNPHLWAEALSKLTGIASNRVDTEGSRKVFDKYQNYLAPKNLSKSLVTAMMSANVMTLKQAGTIISSNSTGKDSRGNFMYNWKKISKELSSIVKDSNSADARNSYVSSLQEQITALDELTVGSLALGETAEEVRENLTNMGVAFDYSLTKGANGLVTFTNSTLAAADSMKHILATEKSVAEINNIKRDYVDSAKEKTRAESINGIIARQIAESVNPERLRTIEGQKELINELSEPMKQIANKITKENALNSMYKEVYSYKVSDGKHYSELMSFIDYLKRGKSKNDIEKNTNLKEKEKKDLLDDLERGTNLSRIIDKNTSIIPQINQIRDFDSFKKLYIPGVNGKFKGGLEESFKRYVNTGIQYDKIVNFAYDKDNKELTAALKGLKTTDKGKDLYSVVTGEEVDKAVEKIKDSIDNYLLKSDLTVEETKNLDTVLSLFGLSVKEISKQAEEFAKATAEMQKNNANTMGWTSALANLSTDNRIGNPLFNSYSKDAATGKYEKVRSKNEYARDYLANENYNGPEKYKNATLFDVTKGMFDLKNNTKSNMSYAASSDEEKLARDINNAYLADRRLQGGLLNDYVKSPFFISDWEKTVNKDVYGLNEYTSKEGREDFVKNNFISTIDSVGTGENFSKDKAIELLGNKGNQALLNNTIDIIKNSRLQDIVKNDGTYLTDKEKEALSGIDASPERIQSLKETINKGNAEGATAEDKEAGLKAQATLDEQIEKFTILRDLLHEIDETSLSGVASGLVDNIDTAAKIDDANNKLTQFKENMGKAFKTTALQGYSDVMKSIGKSAGDAFVNSKSFSDVWKNAGAAMRGVLSSLADQTSQLLMNAGLSLIEEDPKKNLGMGLALIAASGLGSFVSGMLSATEDSDSDDDDEYERLQKLKDNMADLLEQARNDAEYYEKELKNKKAISTNLSYSTTAVSDMILTPQGQFSTAPDDYIFAMKHPEDLRGGSTPVINFNVVNNSSSVTTRTEQQNNADGSVDFVTIIDNVVQEGISQGKYNDAFNAMQAGQNGRQTYA